MRIDPAKLQRLSEWSFKEILFSVAYDATTQHGWVGSSDAGVYQIDLTSEQPQTSRHRLAGQGHTSYVTSMARAGRTLISCGYDKRLIWWDLDSTQSIRSITAHDRWIRKLTLTPDRSRVITVADDMRCRVWDIETGQQIADFSDHAEMTPHHYPSMLYAVAVSADGSRIATADRVGHVALWDAESYTKVGELEAPVMYTWDPKQRRHSIGGIRSLAFSQDGTRLAVGGIGTIGNIDHLGGPARLEIFDLASAVRLHEIEDNKKKGLIEQIHWGPNDEWILTTGGDHNGFITCYDSETGKLLHQADQGGHVHALDRDTDWQSLLLAGHQKLSHWTFGNEEPDPS